ncbi:MAG TPA: tRNA epoxyqueuosine(34) reductase QueG, partial [Porphyromonadaceae bacterium]|nr:tRNA epoxyqueuosine(34) reductase QueG [Porphyromonadaceae bacterium]
MIFSEEIKQQAFALGFDACGICRAEDSGREAEYMRWLADECHADMGYL